MVYNSFLQNLTKSTAIVSAVLLLIAAAPRPLRADVWNAAAGAQSSDMAKQALSFLPNELWIHTGDSIRWTFNTGEIHTVSFLTTGQIRPPLFAPSGAFLGCQGLGGTPDGSNFNGTACVSSTPLTTGQSYTVQFPSAGNFKLVCLVHVRMTGTIHVLDPSDSLPYDQAFYDRQAMNQQADLLSDAASLVGSANSQAQRNSPHGVTAGISAITGNGGGSRMTAVWRFLGDSTVVRVGDTVEWTNLSPTAVHTVTFGAEPANLVPPSANVGTDSDGARHAIISSPNENVNSGFLFAPNEETVGQPESPLDILRFRVTFTVPGTFNYICGIHDVVGMIGKIVVVP